MKFNISPFVVASTLLALSPLSFSALSVTSNSETDPSWVALGFQTEADFIGDQQTGSAESDLVGSGIVGAPASVSFFYTAFDDAGTPDNTDGTIGFRTRHGADSGPGGYTSYVYVGIEMTGDDSIDAYVGINNSGSKSNIFISSTGTDTNNSTGTLSPERPEDSYIWDHSDPANSGTYDWRAVEAPDTPLGNQLLDLNNDGNTDYLLTFTVDFNQLVNFAAAANLKNGDGTDFTLTDETTLRFIAGTSTQQNSLNQDIGGIDGGGDVPLVFSDPILVPEPSSSVLILGALLGFLGIRRRHS